MSEAKKREQQLEQLAVQIEQVGMDKQIDAIGQVYKTVFLVARTHPDQSERDKAADVLIEMQAAWEKGYWLLDSINQDGELKQ